jgi:hypothetical protein
MDWPPIEASLLPPGENVRQNGERSGGQWGNNGKVTCTLSFVSLSWGPTLIFLPTATTPATAPPLASPRTQALVLHAVVAQYVPFPHRCNIAILHHRAHLSIIRLGPLHYFLARTVLDVTVPSSASWDATLRRHVLCRFTCYRLRACRSPCRLSAKWCTSQRCELVWLIRIEAWWGVGL